MSQGTQPACGNLSAMTPDDLFQVADSVLDAARGGEQIEVVVSHARETEVRAYDGDVEAFTSSESRGVGIRVVHDGRQGFAYAGSIEADVVFETLAEARDNAMFSTGDEFVGLVSPDGVEVVEMDLYDPRVAAMSPEEKIALAIELEQRVLEGDPRILGVEMAEYSDSIDTAVLASTTGIRSASSETANALIVYSLAGDDDEVTTGFGFSVGRGPDALDAEAAAHQAVDRALRLLGASRVASQRLTVVFDPWVTAQFLGVIGESFSGIEVFRGRSFLGGRIGERIASPMVTLVDDPTDRRWPTASPIDDEGLATRRNVLIDGGVLNGFVHDGYSARANGVASTGSAVRAGFKSTPAAGVQALSLLPGPRSREDLIASVGDGLYVFEVSGLHSGVNPISGDFSTGVEGVMIRGGEFAEPVKEVTIASTLQRMLGDVTDVADDVTAMPLEATGVTIAIGDVSVSGD
ncbi:MAG: TldD/PmbA family protein [Microthrixaceae bacterium]|nr:TldD/PmbA family protein [Microthrixaceae bacterium]MCO5312367.1 TldD/PmbA family protein [Microthrixaceae bacterium]